MGDVWYRSFDAFLPGDCDSLKKLNNLMGDANKQIAIASTFLESMNIGLPDPAADVLSVLDGCEDALTEIGALIPGELEQREFTNPACDSPCKDF